MYTIDHSVISIVSAATALTASIVGPLVTLYVAKAQIRATTRSANRQKWIEEFRDTVSHFCGQVAVVAQLYETTAVDGHLIIPSDGDSLRHFEQLISTTSRIRLLINPLDQEHQSLILAIDDLLRVFRSKLNTRDMRHEGRDRARHITEISLTIIRNEWRLIQRGL